MTDDAYASTPRTELVRIEGDPEIRGRLFQALADAQGELRNLSKTRTVTVQGKSKRTGKLVTYTFEYTPLDDILAEVRRVLPRQDLCISQLPHGYREGAVLVTTVLGHSHGAYIEYLTRLPTPLREPEPKDVGSLITYARRYAVGSTVGIASEEDQDGKVSGRGQVAAEPGSRPRDPRVAAMVNAYSHLGIDRERLREYLKRNRDVDTFEDMKDEDHAHMVELHKRLQAEDDRAGVIMDTFGPGPADRLEAAEAGGALFGEEGESDAD